MCRTMKESERDSQAAAALEECACVTASDRVHEGPRGGRSAPLPRPGRHQGDPAQLGDNSSKQQQLKLRPKLQIRPEFNICIELHYEQLQEII